MLIRLLSVYSLVSLVVFVILFAVFWTDRTTPKSDRISWLLICISSLVWFIALPLSMVELTRKLLRQDVLQESEFPRRTWN